MTPTENGGLNVCLMNDSFPPTIDGVANAVENYAQIISRGPGRCAVVTPEYPDVVDDYPFPVLRYPSIDTMKLAGYRAGNPLAPDTVAELAGMHFDIIHSHCPVVSTVLARSLREVVDVPIVLTYHTKFDIDIARAVKSKLIRSAAIKMLVANISACDDVWVVSSGAGANLRSLGYQGDYTVMPNGVDLPRGRVDEGAVRALDEQWQLPQDVPVYLFIGRMMWYKNLRIILDALSMLAGAGRDFKMVFIGDGQDKAEVEKYARKLGLSQRCLFVGAVRDRELIRAWYCRADLLLFPSTFDTNGLVVREAAACGLGSVLVRGSCAAEDITDGRTGLLIEENARSLFERLISPDMGPELYRALGQTAMDEIYISWEDSVAAAYERYELIVERWKRGELKRRKGAMDGVLSASGNLMETLGIANRQRRYALTLLFREFDRARDILDRYL